MKYKVYTRLDLVERQAGPLIIARTDEGAMRYYHEKDKFAKANYGIEVLPSEQKILCLGEYDTELDLSQKDNNGSLYPPMLLKAYNQSEVYFIDDVPPGLKPKDFTDTELQIKENKK